MVVVSGAVTFDQVKTMAEKYLGDIPKNKPPRAMNLVEPEQKGERRVYLKKEVATSNMMIAYHVPATKSDDYYALDLLNSILSSGRSSRLYTSLVDSLQLTTSASSSFDPGFDPDLFFFETTGAKGKKVEDIEKALDAQIEKIKKEGVRPEELQKVKNQKLINFYGQIETINGKSNNLGTYEVFFGDYKKMFDAPALYEKVTADDIKRVANKYFKKSNRTVGIMHANVEE